MRATRFTHACHNWMHRLGIVIWLCVLMFVCWYVCVGAAKEIRLKHGAPVIGTFIVDRSLRPLSESAVIKGGSDADSPAATGGHRLVVCTRQQIKVACLLTYIFTFLQWSDTVDCVINSFHTQEKYLASKQPAAPKILPSRNKSNLDSRLGKEKLAVVIVNISKYTTGTS